MRHNALEAVKRIVYGEGVQNDKSDRRISHIFGENVFNYKAMQEYLPESTYLALMNSIKQVRPIDFTTVEDIAEGLKKWALDRGATHFTHWFQPLTGATAEKHDAFFKPGISAMLQGMEKFSASELIQREPDASSFPHGGLRGTEAARGYTVWDPSSPAFILETLNGKTLYIPSIFISYTGEALDNKMPLLKSTEALNKAATAVCHYFEPGVKGVLATLGWEQEYFLIDRNLYYARPDLMFSARTLFGAPPTRGQEKEDHYFGSIPTRVQNFMVDFEREALRVGIPVSTRHNEVAPAQYECAPQFEEVNVSIDHNLLVMEIMNRVAERYGLVVLFHEKPFAGLNGSGKHNNWSMATNEGRNLLSPGNDPGNNLYFITFFINFIAAVNKHEELIRASIAYAGNDHRLGESEAPPAIISVFTGSYMASLLENFKTKGVDTHKSRIDILDVQLPNIPSIALDNTDRNRTSPLPFTGNKFEFRSVGASANCSTSMVILNTIVADQLVRFKQDVDTKIAEGLAKETAIITVLQDYLKESERIIFNGDSYSDEWHQEAARRGLSNNKTTPRALDVLIRQDTIELFARHNIFNERELRARHLIVLENYIKTIDIERKLIVELSETHILPAALNHCTKLVELYKGLQEMQLVEDALTVKNQTQEIMGLVTTIRRLKSEMEQAVLTARKHTEEYEIALAYCDTVKPYFNEIRAAADRLENLVDDDLWKLPRYHEMLFLR